MTIKSGLSPSRQRERDTWTQVRLEVALVKEVDKVVESATVYGARKFWSRNDFAKQAVLKLLKEYKEEIPIARE